MHHHLPGPEAYNSARGSGHMLMHYKIMFDRYYCIKTFCDARKLDNLKENALENSYIRRLYFREKGTFTACVLITPLPGHRQRDV